MTSRPTRAAFSVVAAIALAGSALPAVAHAAPSDPAQGKVESHSFRNQSGATRYWTPERMKNAKNLDQQLPVRAHRGPVDTTGTPKTFQGQEQAVRYASPATRESVKPTIGKVFFTMGGGDYVCSANSVKSANGSVVATAGHCVNEGPGAYAERFIFVPAYNNGSAPYGQWAAVDAYTPVQWSDYGNMNMDTAFVVVGRKNGATLANRVGATGLAFNHSRGLDYTAYGYPAAYPYNGQYLYACRGKAFTNPVDSSSTSQGIPCTMTGGSSGGPWFIGSGYAGTSSLQNSVNSFGYPGLGDYMFGPYWGSTIYSTYTKASNAATY